MEMTAGTRQRFQDAETGRDEGLLVLSVLVNSANSWLGTPLGLERTSVATVPNITMGKA